LVASEMIDEHQAMRLKMMAMANGNRLVEDATLFN